MSASTATGAVAQARIFKAFETCERWFSHRSVITVAILASFLGLLKAGIGVFESPIWPLDSWPRPVEAYPPLTYGYRLIGWALRAESRAVYTIIALLTIAVVVVTLGWLWQRSLNQRQAMWVVLLTVGGPISWVMWGGIGRTDGLVILGGVMLAILGRRIAWALVGSLLAILGNPEQAVILSLALLIITFTPRFGQWRRGSLASLVLASAVWVALTWWSHSLGVPSRTDYFTQLWRQSIHWFFIQFPLELYAAFGLAIFIIAVAILDQQLRHAMVLVTGALLVPLSITALTLDQTRVLVTCSIAATTALLAVYGPPAFEWLSERTRTPLTVTVTAVVVLPAIEITADVVHVPWGYF